MRELQVNSDQFQSPAKTAQASGATTKSKGQQKQQAQASGKDGAASGTAQAGAQTFGEDFTAEQDKKLLALKADNKTWKEIAEAVGRSAGTCKTHYKQLTGGQAQPSDGQGEQKQGEQKKGENQKGDKQKGDQQKQEVQKNSEKDKGKGKGKGKDGVQEVELEPDAVFSKEDVSVPEASGRAKDADLRIQLELLCYLYYQSKHDFWVSIASQFFDLTGRRLSPDVIAAKFAVPR